MFSYIYPSLIHFRLSPHLHFPSHLDPSMFIIAIGTSIPFLELRMLYDLSICLKQFHINIILMPPCILMKNNIITRLFYSPLLVIVPPCIGIKYGCYVSRLLLVLCPCRVHRNYSDEGFMNWNDKLMLLYAIISEKHMTSHVRIII